MRKIIAVLVIISLFGCRKIDNKRFTDEERSYIDSVFMKQAKLAKKRADSICNAEYDERFRHITDSIKTEYIKEIEAIIK